MRVRAEHWQLILSICKKNPELLTNHFNGPEGKAKGNALWQNVATKLNSLGFGEKHVDGWRKALTHWKCKTKAKAAALKREQQATGGRPPKLTPLSSLEEILLEIMGSKALHGDELVPELGFGKVNIPKDPKSATKKHLDGNENKSASENEIEVEEIRSGPSTSHVDYEYVQKPLPDTDFSRDLKRKSEWQDAKPKKNIRVRRSRPNNVVHLSNDLLNLNTDSVKLLRNISSNTENISNALDNISKYTQSIANSLSEISRALQTNNN